MVGLLSIFLLPALAHGLVVPNALKARDAAPFSQQEISPWDSGAVSQYPIHPSCNITQKHLIATGLNETVLLAAHAMDHVLRWGNSSEVYRKYFGNRPTFEVIGSYDVIVNGDKGGVLFRCDNPDGNCGLPGWGGHWRGSNGTDETVICDLSYGTRKFLAQMCMMGYNVAQGPLNTYWASDLLHRLYHMPAIGQDHIEHYANNYREVITLSTSNTTYSTHDSDTLQFFALEVYAYDIAVPGLGCPGPQAIAGAISTTLSTSASVATSSASSITAIALSTSSTPGATRVISDPPSSTSSIPTNCHTHEGGVLHCT